MALAAYRNLLRAINVAFKDDQHMLSAARQQSRAAFLSSSTASPSEAPTLIAHANDVAKVLRENVVQGVKQVDESGKEVYKLRIHDEIEKGDNDFIRNPDTGMVRERKKAGVSEVVIPRMGYCGGNGTRSGAVGSVTARSGGGCSAWRSGEGG